MLTVNGVPDSGVSVAASAPDRMSNIWIVEPGVPSARRVPSGCTPAAVYESSPTALWKTGANFVRS